jgi:protein gp37
MTPTTPHSAQDAPTAPTPAPTAPDATGAHTGPQEGTVVGATRPGPPYIIRRTDGGDVHGDGYRFMECDSPDDWTVAEESEHYDGPVEYEILRCVPVASRVFGVPEPDAVVSAAVGGSIQHALSPYAAADLDEHRARLWDLIEQTPHLDWMLLTKRPENMARMAPARWGDRWPDNIWAGCTAEDQQAFNERVRHLVAFSAAVRFISYEPALGPLDLDGAAGIDAEDLDLVICGGESGHGARPMHPDWARAVRDQCQRAGVAFHFKQWGEWAPAEHVPDASMSRLARASAWPDEQAMVPVGTKAAGRVLDGCTWDEMPERRERAS